MKNFIQIGDKQITLDPKNQEEYDLCVNTCNHILAVMVTIGTSDVKEDSKRVEAVLNFSGKLGGDVAKRALALIGKEKTATEPEPEVDPKPDEGTPNA